jgi:hypothetical protein
MTRRRLVLLLVVLAAAVVAFAARPASSALQGNSALARPADVVAGADSANAGVMAAVAPTQRDGSSTHGGLIQLAVLASAAALLGTGMWSTLRRRGSRARGRVAERRGAIRAPPLLLSRLTLS